MTGRAILIQLFRYLANAYSAQQFEPFYSNLASSMALHRVRLDSTSSGGVNQKNDQDDEMASEKQRLDIIEVLSFMPVIRNVDSVVYYQKSKY